MSSVAVAAGGVYYVRDSSLTLPPEQARSVHASRRLFVVLSGSTNSDSGWLTVVGCPISSSTSFKTRFDVKLAAGEAGVMKKCWIRVPAIQPIAKVDLEDYAGALSEHRLHEVRAQLLDYLGMLEEPPDPWDTPAG